MSTQGPIRDRRDRSGTEKISNGPWCFRSSAIEQGPQGPIIPGSTYKRARMRTRTPLNEENGPYGPCCLQKSSSEQGPIGPCLLEAG